MPKLDNQTILLAFAVITGLALLLQTIFLFVIFLAVRHATKSIREQSEKLRALLVPIIYDAREILSGTRDAVASTQEFLTTAQSFVVRIRPKVEAAASELSAMAHDLRAQTVKLQASVEEITARVELQSSRVDGMVTQALDSVDRAGGFLADAVSVPVRQASSILRSAKAVIETLRGPARP